MRLIGLTTVRDEADILGQCLEHALRLHDAIIVVDCGSVDDSPNVAERSAAVDRRVIVLPPLPPMHPMQVKRHIWGLFRTHLSSSDWWSIVDADEFPHEDLRAATRIAASEWADHIFSMHANFYYKESEAECWRVGAESASDRARPITARRRFYRMHTSVPRLFRNLQRLRWNADTHYPRYLIRPASFRVAYRHYQYRDLGQIEQRIMVRRQWGAESPFTGGDPHWMKSSVDEAISRDDDPMLKEYMVGGPLEVDPSMPPLRVRPWWKSVALRGLAQTDRLKRQSPQTLFSGIDARDLLARAGLL